MRELDPTDPGVWAQVRDVVSRGQSRALHCALGSINADGSPHLTPIGSLRLGQPGHAIYLDVANVTLGRNLDRDPRCAVMAVDSSRTLWLRSLLTGRFDEAPGVRLLGTVGPPRPSTEEESERFARAVKPALRTRGGRNLWGRLDQARARDITFHSVVPVRLPRMTNHLWA